MDTRGNAAGVQKLPIEILSKIFNSLDHGSILEASRVCKSWNNIISSSNKFLNSTLITLKIRNMKTKFKLTRSYHNLKIVAVDDCEIRKGHLDQISRVCGSLKSLQFTKRSTVRAPDLIEFLNRCENLTKLEIEDLSEKVSKDSSVDNVLKLPKLSEVILHDSDWLIKYMVDIDNLNFLEVSRSTEKRSQSQYKILHFLNKLQNLDKLALRGVDLRSDMNLEPQFQWNHLKISDIDVVMGEHMQENWQKLIDAAKSDSKVSIERRIAPEFALPLLQVMSVQQNITKMKIELSSFPLISILFLDTTFNHVKSLKLRRTVDETEVDAVDMDEDEITKFMVMMQEIDRRFVNVELLDLKWQAALFVGDIAANDVITVFSNVKHLKLDSLMRCMTMSGSVTYPSLVTLELDVTRENLICFMAETGVGVNNPTLRKLIMNFDEGTEDIHQNSWRRCLARLPTVQQFELNFRSGGSRLMSRSDVENGLRLRL